MLTQITTEKFTIYYINLNLIFKLFELHFFKNTKMYDFQSNKNYLDNYILGKFLKRLTFRK